MIEKKGRLQSNGVIATGVGLLYSILKLMGWDVEALTGVAQGELVEALGILVLFVWGLWGRLRATKKIEGWWQ